MMLSRILEHKKAERRHKQSRGYLAELKTQIRDNSGPLGFAVALDATRSTTSPALIAEVKKASPSLGLLRQEFNERFDPVGMARAYQEAGAAAELQFYESRAYGADAVLLIVAALERTQLVDFHALARELELDVLIETHHERELDTVLEWIPDARMVGINNRDLTTFTTDLTITKRLAPRIPPGKLIVSESGIHTRSHVEQLLDIGIHAMLVGESLIKAENSRAKIQELRGVRSAAQA